MTLHLMDMQLTPPAANVLRENTQQVGNVTLSFITDSSF